MIAFRLLNVDKYECLVACTNLFFCLFKKLSRIKIWQQRQLEPSHFAQLIDLFISIFAWIKFVILFVRNKLNWINLAESQTGKTITIGRTAQFIFIVLNQTEIEKTEVKGNIILRRKYTMISGFVCWEEKTQW